MAKNRSYTGALRQLAEELIEQIAEDEGILDAERSDLVTALVRQWITYDGHATLFLRDIQVYLHLVRTPLGRPRPVPEAGVAGWIEDLTQDWKIDPDEIPELLAQLNRGQSAETTNRDGIPLRLWVDPKAKGRGVEPLVKQEIPPGTKRDYRKIAAHELRKHFGDGLDADEMDELICSVARQWQKFGGCACLFVEDQQLIIVLIEQPGGGCNTKSGWIGVEIKAALSSLGFSEAAIPEVIARINCGQEIEYRDKDGVPTILWHDPRARKLISEQIKPGSIQSAPSMRPIFCPQCNAVLLPWQPEQRQQNCPLCRHTIALNPSKES